MKSISAASRSRFRRALSELCLLRIATRISGVWPRTLRGSPSENVMVRRKFPLSPIDGRVEDDLWWLVIVVSLPDARVEEEEGYFDCLDDVFWRILDNIFWYWYSGCRTVEKWFGEMRWEPGRKQLVMVSYWREGWTIPLFQFMYDFGTRKFMHLVEQAPWLATTES